ncbi:MAG: ATP-binding cassette domain-containing protein, partial [Sphingobium sp.]
MPASIRTFDLSWSTPEGQPILFNLNLSFNQERIGIVGRNGVGKTSLLALLAGERQPVSGRITTTGTIASLRQTLRVAPDETIADLFGVTADLAMLRRAESGDATVEDLAEADWTLEDRIASALARVGLDVALDSPLAALSGGQRTRAAMAAAVLAAPDFLLLDEPSNNLDREGRAALLELLSAWRAGAIVISHDRELLDTMDAIVEMTSLGATRYGGNWTQYRERKATELAAAHHDLDVAERQLAEIARKSQVTLERKQRRDATGSRKGARGDMPKILVGARKERAQNSGADNARLAERQRADATAAALAARGQIEQLETTTVHMAPTGLPAGKLVLALRNVTAGYDPLSPIFQNFSVSLVGPERVAVIGPNGSGKTSLLDLIMGRIAPWTGTVTRPCTTAMVDQTLAILDPSLSIAENFHALNPEAGAFTCRSALARFQFRADAALQPVHSLSGGQMLRAGLACILGSPTPPQLLILDEPTN